MIHWNVSCSDRFYLWGMKETAHAFKDKIKQTEMISSNSSMLSVYFSVFNHKWISTLSDFILTLTNYPSIPAINPPPPQKKKHIKL